MEAPPGTATPGTATPGTATPGTATQGDPAVLAEILGSTPVAAQDVTASDGSLSSTRNEVAVLAESSTGTPTVVKLRADSAREASELADHLDALPGVVASPNARMRAFALPEPLEPQQWNLAMVGAQGAWAGSQGVGVVVAVVDSGVDAGHPDFSGAVLPEIDMLPDINPAPVEHYHGTAVASLVAGAINGFGMAGVAPQARILPVAALDPSGVGDSSTVAAGIIAAADAGARVINLSLGGPDRDPVLDRACAYAFAKGAVLVAAAGNTYNEGNEVQYPAATPNVLGVAAVDSTGNPSGFSNTGKHIDLAAPGEDVLAATPGGGHELLTGTSFSTPHVAAAAALVASANPSLSAEQIASTVQLTAQDDLSGNGRDNQLGYGVVRADRAVATAVTLRGPGLPAKPRLRLRKLNAFPEPTRRGEVATITVVTQAKFTDRKWRAYPVPTTVHFQFKRQGTKRYRTVATVAAATDGRATMTTTPTKSGKWRAKVRTPSGKWVKSRVDLLKVRK
jgi:subtilisin family serine protease